MARFIELEFASGISAPHRGKDLFDVHGLIRSANLRRRIVSDLDPWVREQFLETWQLGQAINPF